MSATTSEAPSTNTEQQQQQDPSSSSIIEKVAKKNEEITYPEEGIVDETLRSLAAMTCRDWTTRTVLVFFLAATSIVIWKLIIILCWSEIPIVVVLSGSMEPGYQRGDLLVLSSPNRPVEVGDIVVFKIKGRDIPIVHRVHRMHIDTDGKRHILTKGDNNYGDDRALYNPGQNYIAEDDIMGRSVMYVPFVGQFTILMAETKGLREIVIVVLLVFVFLVNEE